MSVALFISLFSSSSSSSLFSSLFLLVPAPFLYPFFLPFWCFFLAEFITLERISRWPSSFFLLFSSVRRWTLMAHSSRSFSLLLVLFLFPTTPSVSLWFFGRDRSSTVTKWRTFRGISLKKRSGCDVGNSSGPVENVRMDLRRRILLRGMSSAICEPRSASLAFHSSAHSTGDHALFRCHRLSPEILVPYF